MPGPLRAFLRAAAKLHLRRWEAAERHSTVRAVFLGDFVSSKVMLDGIYEGRELDALAREVFPQLPKESTAIDVGANIGNHTVFFAKHFGRVVAFEPNPMVAALLNINTAKFGSGVQVLPFGLSEASTELDFSVDGRNLGASRVSDQPTGTVIEVKALDEVASDLRLSDLSFVKIDAEGHEDKVIAGARSVLSATQPIIALEGFYKADPEKGARVSGLLGDLGYQHFYRLSDRRNGEPRALHSVTPKVLRRRRQLHLERIGGLIGEDHSLVVVSAKPLKSGRQRQLNSRLR